MLETNMRKFREELLRQGHDEGVRTSIKLLLTQRFGDEARSLDAWLDGISEAERLSQILLRAAEARTLIDVREIV